MMKKATAITVLALLAFYAFNNPEVFDSGDVLSKPDVASAASESRLVQAYENQQSDVQVRGVGTVSRILSDDNDGSRHQRFIISLSTGQTILIAHNIDLAPRLNALGVGDQVEFYGEYEWNDRGGVIHWTHHDPRGRHVGGWLRHKGQTYQ